MGSFFQEEGSINDLASGNRLFNSMQLAVYPYKDRLPHSALRSMLAGEWAARPKPPRLVVDVASKR